jgi:hypothetical protein
LQDVARELEGRCQEQEHHHKSERLVAAFIRLLIAVQERADVQLTEEVDTLVEAKKAVYDQVRKHTYLVATAAEDEVMEM